MHDGQGVGVRYLPSDRKAMQDAVRVWRVSGRHENQAAAPGQDGELLPRGDAEVFVSAVQSEPRGGL